MSVSSIVRSLVCAASIAFAVSCSDESGRRAPNVLLVTFDTLRADHVSCYGYAKPTTPRLDALAARATRYTRCVAASPWTLPSHASLFTGQFPSEHGAHIVRLEQFSAESGSRFDVRAASSESLMLAEYLLEQGYATAMHAANPLYLAQWVNLDQGFETATAHWRDAAQITDLAVDWLGARPQDRPFFLFVNYMDCHCPATLRQRAEQPLRILSNNDGRALIRTLDAALVAGEPPPQSLIWQLRNQYDVGLAFADEQLGRLLEAIEAQGELENTLVVVTSDHGEEFAEHGLTEHGRSVYEEVLAVPLVIKAPHQSEPRVDELAISHVDLPAMIVRELGGEVARRGAELFPRTPGSHPIVAELHYSRMKDMRDLRLQPRFDRVQRAIYDGRFKFIESSDGRHELYDLERDPGETQNLYGADAPATERFVQALRRFEADLRPLTTPGASGVDPKQTDALEELGYL